MFVTDSIARLIGVRPRASAPTKPSPPTSQSPGPSAPEALCERAVGLLTGALASKLEVVQEKYEFSSILLGSALPFFLSIANFSFLVLSG